MKAVTNIAVAMIALAALVLSGCGRQSSGPTDTGVNDSSHVLAQDGAGTHAEAPAPENVKFTTEDDVVIYANYYKPAAETTAAVILIHQRGSSKESWSTIAGGIVAKGYAVLAFDMRGHGQSTKTTDGQAVGEPEQGQWWECKKDAQAAIKFLRDKGFNKIAVVGASVGASIAIYCASENDDVKGLILLSPVIAIDPAVVQAAASLGNRKVFIYCTKNDDRGGNEESAQQFAGQMADTPHQLHVFDGKDHGTAMLGKKYGDFDVNENILEELDSILK
jgi:pimeloyl-ACP methyl ester carboxylesterase